MNRPNKELKDLGRPRQTQQALNKATSSSSLTFQDNSTLGIDVPWKIFLQKMDSRVPQKNQKSEFCFATKPTCFHRLDEPPEKFQH